VGDCPFDDLWPIDNINNPNVKALVIVLVILVDFRDDI
jgi:hypothetical protein